MSDLALLEAMKDAIAASEVMQGPEKVERIPSRITTFSGRHIDPLDLDPADVSLEDIAHHLSMQCRWSGACRFHYSVAQHAYLASYLVPEDEAYDVLHHDDAEYALQDMAKPLKNHMTLGKAYRGAEQRIERVLGPLLGVQFPVTLNTKAADLLMLCAEADQLIHGRKHWTYYQDFPAAAIEIQKWTPEKTERKWLARHDELSKGRT